MAATTIVELALQSYVPSTRIDELPPGFVRKGKIIVGTGRHPLTTAEVQASIDADREGDRD